MLTNIQAEHREWVDRMYPGQHPDIPAAGMVEEAGELLHAILALRRAETWGEESRRPMKQLRDALRDAIGDCAIYVCSYANAMACDVGMYDAKPACAGEAPLCLAVELVQTAAQFFTTRAVYYGEKYIALLKQIAIRCAVHYGQAVADTWAEVRKRTR